VRVVSHPPPTRAVFCGAVGFGPFNPGLQNGEVRVFFLVYRVGPGIYTGKPAETLQQNEA
jgi:hypothetical protein